MKKCPFCSKEVLEEAIICRFCKSDIPSVNSSSQADNLAADNSVKATEPVKAPMKFSFVNIGIIIMMLIILGFIFYLAYGLSTIGELPLLHEVFYLVLLISLIIIPAMLFVWRILKR